MMIKILFFLSIVILINTSHAESISLNIRTATGDVTVISVETDRYISDIKNEISQSDISVHPLKQRLIFNGITMSEGKLLSDYGLQSGNTLDVHELDGKSTEHYFSSGDDISVDVLNEATTYATLSNSPVSNADLLGTWHVTQTTNKMCDDPTPYATDPDYPQLNGYESDQNNFTWSRTTTVEITWPANSGYLEFCSSSHDVFANKYSFANWDIHNTENHSIYSSSPGIDADALSHWQSNYDGCGYISTIGHKIFASTNGYFDYDSYRIEQVDGAGVPVFNDLTARYTVKKTRTNPETIYFHNTPCNLIKLTRIDNRPLAPSKLNITTSGLTNSLNWTDNSDNESEFYIFRRPGNGQWTRIETDIPISSNTTSYNDTVPSPGVYRYRIRAVESSGKRSSGSNVIKTNNQ